MSTENEMGMKESVEKHSTFKEHGFIEHGGYIYTVGQFVGSEKEDGNDYTSPLLFFPAVGRGDGEHCYESASKVAKSFEKMVDATKEINLDGGVRNAIIWGANSALLTGYGVNSEKLKAVWDAKNKDGQK